MAGQNLLLPFTLAAAHAPRHDGSRAPARSPHPRSARPPLRRLRAWKTNLLLVLQAVLFIALIWVVDRAGEGFLTGTFAWQRQLLSRCYEPGADPCRP